MPLAAAVGRRPDREGIPAADRGAVRVCYGWGVVSMRGRVLSYREITVPPDTPIDTRAPHAPAPEALNAPEAHP